MDTSTRGLGLCSFPQSSSRHGSCPVETAGPGKAYPIGVHWLARFIKRHPEIDTKVGKRQEASRFNSFTPMAVNWYFDIRESEYGWIRPENTVNVDEGGIMARFGLDSLVIGSSDPRRKAFLKGSQSRTWTRFIEAATADGRLLKPGIIFKGKELQKQWFIDEFNKIADWYYITSDNGWTDNHIAVEWLKEVYLPQTQPADESDTRLIILDGHGSHVSDEWMATCFFEQRVLLLPACTLLSWPTATGQWCFQRIQGCIAKRTPKTGKPDGFCARGQGQLHQGLCQSQGSGYDEEKHPFRLENDWKLADFTT
ncbi:transposase [Fusarium oxysporum f. sp. phaseoli]